MRPRSAVRRTLLIALAFAAALAGCGDDSPMRPGAGPTAHLGLVANPSDFVYADSIASALLTARATGATMFQAGELWSALEPAPGAFDGAAIRRQLAALQSLGFATYFNFRIVDTNQRGVPADLAGTAWDDPAMIARADVAIDTILAVATRFPLLAFSFGNEVDGYFATRPAELPAFRALLQRERARLRAGLPSLPVGCCTMSPPFNAGAWVGDTLNAVTDVVLYTYYPFVPASDFQHRPPSTFGADVAAMLARAGTKPLALQEVGYSSSPVNGSSPALQAEFVRAFRNWVATQPRSRVLFANWFLMTDWSSATVNMLFGYYGASSPGFGAYLGNLGLRDSTGAPKASWNAWRAP